MSKVIGGAAGLLVGLLASSRFKPQTIFGTVSLAEWFSVETCVTSYGATILICGALGTVAGVVMSLFIDRGRTARPS